MKQSRRIDGTFFATALILFVLIASVFCIKTTIYRERIHDYQEQLQKVVLVAFWTANS